MASDNQTSRPVTFLYRRGSWLKNCSIAQLEDRVESWAFFDDVPSFSEKTTDLILTLDSVLRPEQIASDYYGRPELWWVICVANDIRVPLTELYPGRTIRIPDPESVLRQVRTEGRLNGQ